MNHPSRERCAVLIKTVKIIEHNYSKCESWRRSNRGPRPEQCTLYIFCNSLCILTLKKLKHVESRGGKIALECTVIVWYEKDGENCGEVLVKQALKAAVKSVKHRPRTEWSRSTFTHMYICGKRKRRKLFLKLALQNAKGFWKMEKKEEFERTWSTTSRCLLPLGGGGGGDGA